MNRHRAAARSHPAYSAASRGPPTRGVDGGQRQQTEQCGYGDTGDVRTRACRYRLHANALPGRACSGSGA